MKHIAILDFGSQYTHLIARNIRELEVLAKIYPHDTPASELHDAIGVIISGGPQSVYDKKAIKIDERIFSLDVPILGLCYGHQLLAHMLGGQVRPGKVREFGESKLSLKKKSPLFRNLTSSSIVWMSHGDSVTKLPSDFETIGSTPHCDITAMASRERKIYGLQFHPEVDHTREGSKIFQNFVLEICTSKQDWKIDNIISHLIDQIKQQAKNKKVLVLVSGGVDSNVAFALLTKALGKKRVKGLYIDTGFMRASESDEIIRGFKKLGYDNIKNVDASATFYERLKGIYEPEEKREIIGQTFLDIKDQMTKELGLNAKDWMLGQGTIYPDTIESGGTKNADKIKTHHNRVDAVQKLIEKGLVIEPLVDFYKYEVRRIGKLLGLPKELINRHPFPGPGLAIRILCQNDKQPVQKLSSVSNKFSRLAQEKFSHVKFSILPLKSVGVQGDNRTYAHPAVVWKENDWKKLNRLATLATNSIRELNRVILLLNPGRETPNFVLKKENCYLTPERIELLREMDKIVNNTIKKAGLYDKIWQFPIVLIPVTDGSDRESIVLRPIDTRDVMTFTFYPMAKKVLREITRQILATGKVSYVFYDITNKPPGTTEWE